MPKSLLMLSPADTGGLLPAAVRASRCRAEQAEQVAPLLKALADPVRLRLMSLVASHPGGEACVCDLTDAFDLSQPTISHHLKVLHEAGLLDRDKRGVWVYYRARTDALASLGALIGDPPQERAADRGGSPQVSARVTRAGGRKAGLTSRRPACLGQGQSLPFPPFIGYRR